MTIFKEKQTGSGLLSVLMAVGISGIVVAGLSQMFQHSLKAQKNIELRNELSSIRDRVSKIDCSASLSNCLINGQSLDLLETDKLGNESVFAGAAGAKFGAWRLRGVCRIDDEKGKTIEFQSGRYREEGSTLVALQDPLTGKSQEFANMFPNDSGPCDGGSPDDEVPEGVVFRHFQDSNFDTVSDPKVMTPHPSKEAMALARLVDQHLDTNQQKIISCARRIYVNPPGVIRHRVYPCAQTMRWLPTEETPLRYTTNRWSYGQEKGFPKIGPETCRWIRLRDTGGNVKVFPNTKYYQRMKLNGLKMEGWAYGWGVNSFCDGGVLVNMEDAP